MQIIAEAASSMRELGAKTLSFTKKHPLKVVGGAVAAVTVAYAGRAGFALLANRVSVATKVLFKGPYYLSKMRADIDTHRIEVLGTTTIATVLGLMSIPLSYFNFSSRAGCSRFLKPIFYVAWLACALASSALFSFSVKNGSQVVDMKDLMEPGYRSEKYKEFGLE